MLLTSKEEKLNGDILYSRLNQNGSVDFFRIM